MAAAGAKGGCKACLSGFSSCTRACAAGLSRSRVVTEVLLGLTFVVMAGMIVFSLVETQAYGSNTTAWRCVQGIITCIFAALGAYAVPRKAKAFMWSAGVTLVLSGIIWFIVMCIDADQERKAVAVSCEGADSKGHALCHNWTPR